MTTIRRYVSLLLDLATVRLLVWILGRDGELLDSHLFFYHRYSDLATYHREHGRLGRADRLDALAEAHYRAAPDNDEPPAAALAMPVPRPPTRTAAVSRDRLPSRPVRRPMRVTPRLPG